MILEWREDYEIWGAFDCGMEEKGATIFSENELLRAGGRPSVRSIYWSAHLTSRRVRDAPRWSPSWPSSGWNAGASSLSNSAWYFDLAMVNLSPEMCRCVCALSRLRVGMFASILAPTPGSPSLPCYRCILAGVHSQRSSCTMETGRPLWVSDGNVHMDPTSWTDGLRGSVSFCTFSIGPPLFLLSYPSVSFKSSLGFNSL